MRASNVVVASVAAAAAAALAGCEPTAPANPSFQTDILPILAANCVRCHSRPQIGGAPVEFRLDSFADVLIDVGDRADPKDDVYQQGAATYAPSIGPRIVSTEFPMPPRFPLQPYQIDTLLAWTVQEPPTRGEPRPGNQLPVLSIRELGRSGATVTLAYELHDPDGDLVVGQLCFAGATAEDPCAFAAPLQSGNIIIDLAIPATVPLPVVLRAKLDDGAGVVDQAALTVGES